jgi:hypothetical protein
MGRDRSREIDGSLSRYTYEQEASEWPLKTGRSINVGGREITIDTIESSDPKAGEVGEIHGHPLGTSGPISLRRGPP